jgi:hypothetical protein
MIFNVAATILYITAFITCSAAVDVTSLKGSRQYNQRAAASVSMSWGSPAVYRGDTAKSRSPDLNSQAPLIIGRDLLSYHLHSR